MVGPVLAGVGGGLAGKPSYLGTDCLGSENSSVLPPLGLLPEKMGEHAPFSLASVVERGGFLADSSQSS